MYQEWAEFFRVLIAYYRDMGYYWKQAGVLGYGDGVNYYGWKHLDALPAHQVIGLFGRN